MQDDVNTRVKRRSLKAKGTFAFCLYETETIHGTFSCISSVYKCAHTLALWLKPRGPHWVESRAVVLCRLPSNHLSLGRRKWVARRREEKVGRKEGNKPSERDGPAVVCLSAARPIGPCCLCHSCVRALNTSVLQRPGKLTQTSTLTSLM